MKKEKGFTLIELLAVIIILAVIALIATPIVLNVVEKAQEQARQASVAGYADAIKTTAYEYYLNNQAYPTTIDTSKVVNHGDKVYYENVLYSKDHGVVLNNCSVKEETSEKKYCFAEGKTYSDCSNQEYQDIYTSIGTTVTKGNPLIDELLKQYNETNTVGLLKEGNNYYYKGNNTQVANNFVWWGGHLWRVLTINEDNTLTMITQQPLTAIQPASSVWTTQAEYEASYINHWLNSEEDGVFYKSLTQADKDKILASVFNVGITTNVSEIVTTQKVGLPDRSIYEKAGSSNSFLNISDYWMLGNRCDESNICHVNDSGSFLCTAATSASGVRPVIRISDLTFSEGSGTLMDPYRRKSATTDIANIKIGEYISIPTSGSDCGEDNRCLFRVASKDSNSIKVTLNGLLKNTTVTLLKYTSNNAIDTKIKSFAGTIDETYRYIEMDKTFSVGTYGDGANYKNIQNETYIGNVGLPVIGEMFTGNDIDLTQYSKLFVNVETIENPSVSNWYWTMNAYSNNNVCYVSQIGTLGNNTPWQTYGVRPVIFLKNNLSFTSGEGTAENPFMLGE